MTPWRRANLGDIATYINGYPFAPADWGAEGLPIVRIQNLTNSSGVSNFFAGKIDSRYEIEDGDILISWSGSLGVYEWQQGRALLNQHIFKAVFDKGEIDKKYFKIAVEHALGEMEKYLHGSTMKHITKGYFDSIEIPLPPLETQRKIAAVLDKAQELINLRKAQIKKLDEFLRSVFLDMFGDPVTNPKGWNFQRLNQLCDVRDGTHDSPSYVDYGYPLITSKNINGDKIDFSLANLISEEDFMLIRQRSEVNFGDIIMPMIGTIGHPVIVNTNKSFAIKNVALIKFTDKSIVSNIYLRDLFRSHYFFHLIKDINRGGTQKFIALGDIRAFSIPVPHQSFQYKYVAIVEKTEQQKELMQQSLTEMENNFNSLMQRAFRGELF